MRGISVWMFSKLVMLVFLVVTFSIVIGFLKLTNDKVASDAAESMAIQIKDAIQATTMTGTTSSGTIVPIPKTLPEGTHGIEEKYQKPFIATINSTISGGQKIVFVAVGWQTTPGSYAATASFVANPDLDIKPANGINLISGKHLYLVVNKTSSNELCFRACTSYYFATSCSGC